MGDSFETSQTCLPGQEGFGVQIVWMYLSCTQTYFSDQLISPWKKMAITSQTFRISIQISPKFAP